MTAHHPRATVTEQREDGVAAHAMVWTFEGDYTTVQAVCNAAEDADCRLQPADFMACQCEYWGQIVRKDDGTIWHTVTEGYYAKGEPNLHRVIPGGECNVALSINASGCAEELCASQKAFTLATVPFEPVYDGEDCTWSPTSTEDPRCLPGDAEGGL